MAESGCFGIGDDQNCCAAATNIALPAFGPGRSIVPTDRGGPAGFAFRPQIRFAAKPPGASAKAGATR